jgi:hypothetical protein
MQRVSPVKTAGNVAGADIGKNLPVGTYLEVAVAFAQVAIDIYFHRKHRFRYQTGCGGSMIPPATSLFHKYKKNRSAVLLFF